MGQENIKKQAIFGFAWKFAERLLAQGVSFVVTIVLARLLFPSDYAPITLITVFITIANVFVADGFSAALIQKKDAEPEDYYTVLWGGTALSVGIYCILYVIAPYVAQFYGMPILTPTLRVLSLRIIIAAVNSVENAYLSKNMQFKKFFWATFGGMAVSAVVGIAMAYLGYGVWALVAQNLVNYAIGTVVLAFVIGKRPRLYFSWKRMKSLFSFGGSILATNLLFTVVDQLRTVLIGRIYSPDDLSFYSKGRHYPQLVSQSISTPLSSVSFPAMAKMQSDIGAVRGFLRKGTQLTSYLVSPIVLGLAAVSNTMVPLLMTDKWIPCIPYVWIGAIYYLLPPIHSFNLEAVKAIGRGKDVVKYGFIKRGISLLTLVATVWISPIAIAWGLVASAVIATFINAYQNKKLFFYTYKDQFFDLVPNLICAAIVCIAVNFIGDILPVNMFVAMMIQVLLGVILYVLLSVITRNTTFTYILSMAKGILFKNRKN